MTAWLPVAVLGVLAVVHGLATPFAVLVGAGLALGLAVGRWSPPGTGARGPSEALHAFASAANTNGGALAGLGADNDPYNIGRALVMQLGRFLPMVLVAALARSLARQRPIPVTAGPLPARTATSGALIVGMAVLVVGLAYLPTLALGPLADGAR
jgi:K+-transporting ATPase ATPase A chain